MEQRNSKDQNTLQNPLSFNKLWFCFSFNLLYGIEAYIPSSVELFTVAPDRIKFYLLIRIKSVSKHK